MIWAVLVLLLILTPAAYASFRFAPFFPTWRKDLGQIEKLIKLGKNDRFYELGSGLGDISLRVAKDNPQAKIVAVEVQPLLFLIALLRFCFSGLSNLSLRFNDFYRENLCSADVLYLYSTPRGNLKLIAKLERELRPGATVISYAFPFVRWKPLKVFQEKGRLPIYIYKR